MCTARVLRDYFVHGVVPLSETHCPADPDTLFPPPKAIGMEAESDEDSKLREDLWELSRVPAGF